MSALDVIDLSKAYNGNPVLRGVSLAIEPGECMSLLGAPSAGKSVLLRLLAGLEQVSSGEVCVGDKPVTHLPPQLRNIALITKNSGLYPHMSVAENLGFALTLRRYSKDRIKSEVQQVAAELGITPLLSAPTSTLSCAEQQRVALARALVRAPEVILLDDPFAGLAGDQSEALREQCREAILRLGATAIFATSDADAALDFGHRVAALTDGQIAQVDAPAALLDRPMTLEVALLAARAPLVQIHGRLSEDGARFVARDGTFLPLPMDEAPDAAFGAALVFAFRAASVRHDPASSVKAELLTSQQLRLARRISLRLAGTEFVLPCPLLAPTVPETDTEIGLSFDPQTCHLFDRETGQRL